MELCLLGQSGVHVRQIVQVTGTEHALNHHPCMVELIVRSLWRKRARLVEGETVVQK